MTNINISCLIRLDMFFSLALFPLYLCLIKVFCMYSPLSALFTYLHFHLPCGSGAFSLEEGRIAPMPFPRHVVRGNYQECLAMCEIISCSCFYISGGDVPIKRKCEEELSGIGNLRESILKKLWRMFPVSLTCNISQ